MHDGLRWLQPRSIEARCPVCGAVGTKSIRLEVASPFPGRGLRTLLDCRSCTSQFFDDQALPPESYEDNPASVTFYMQQAASIEHMIWPLLRIPVERRASLADIGCGFGFALDFARTTMGWRARGIDRSTAADMGARLLGVDIVPAHFDGPQSFGGETFDVVLSSEVIEHMPDPNRFVLDVLALLQPRGTAVFTTPNAAAIRPEQPVSELLRILSPGFHHVFFTARSLRAVLERGGFTAVQVDEELDNLTAYASRAPLDLLPFARVDEGRYREYLAERGRAPGVDVDLRIGFKYRYFKALVNMGAWPEARAEFSELRAIVRQRHHFDLDAPDTIPALDAIPFDLPLDHARANTFFERFMATVPSNLVGLLFFRGALALGTGASREAVDFFRAAGKVGVVARSLRLTLASSDGEITDLFKQSFLLGALALADLAPDESLIEADRILDGEPPAGVPHPLWTFSAKEREWLLGAVFARLVDRGHTAAAEHVFDRLCMAVAAAYGFELTQPESVPRRPRPGRSLTGTRQHADGDESSHRSLPPDLARIVLARGLLDLNAGRHVDALRYFRTATELLTATSGGAGELPPPDSDRIALLMRSRVHSVLALAGVDPEAALAELTGLLADTPPGKSSTPWHEGGPDRLQLVGSVFAALVNRGAGTLAARLVADVEAALGAADGEAPDAAHLAARSDLALDAAFCRAMLALNHEQAPHRAAAWFHSVYRAASACEQEHSASPSARALLWTARYHEALSLALADNLEAAVAIAESMKTPPPGISPMLWHGAGPDTMPVVSSVFVRVVNRGDGPLAARLVADVEAALGAADGEAPDPVHLAARSDLALDATFCRAMLALNHEQAPHRAAAWFHSVYAAASAREHTQTASPSAQALLWIGAVPRGALAGPGGQLGRCRGDGGEHEDAAARHLPHAVARRRARHDAGRQQCLRARGQSRRRPARRPPGGRRRGRVGCRGRRSPGPSAPGRAFGPGARRHLLPGHAGPQSRAGAPPSRGLVPQRVQSSLGARA